MLVGMADEPHDPHDEIPKHLQLGVDPENPGDTSRKMLKSEEDIDAAWADATTVEQFKEDIETLAREA